MILLSAFIQLVLWDGPEIIRDFGPPALFFAGLALGYFLGS